MKNKISINQKLDLLLISLESLDTLQIDHLVKVKNNNIYTDTHKSQNINNHSIDLVRYAISIQKYQKKTHNCFTNFIIYIHKIHKKTNEYLLCQKANLILRQYIKQHKSANFKQYIRKFNYLYFEPNKYYTNCKNTNKKYKQDITLIAIQNLYIVTKLNNTQGIYTLIKYLNN